MRPSNESLSQADAVWQQYERDGQAEALARKHTAFFRATFLPSLTAALERADDTEACRRFADRFEDGLRQRLVREPTPTNSRVDTVVIAKLPAGAA